MPRSLERLFHLAAAICIVTLVVLSLLPADDLARTSAGGPIEHFVAYCGTAALLACGLQGRRHLVYAALGLIVLAGTLELAQNLVPSRSPGLDEFVGSALGACVGVLIGAMARRIIAHRL